MHALNKIILIALVVILAGCSGLAGSDAQPGISIETTTTSDTIDYDSSDYATVRISNDAEKNISTAFSATFAGQEIHNSTERLAPGSSKDIQLYFNSSDLDPGEHDLVLQVDSESEIKQIRVLEPRPSNFEITDIDGANSLPTGSPAQFDVDIENTGDLAGSSDITASFVGHETSERIELEGGEETTVSFKTSEIEAEQGTYSLEVKTRDDDLQQNVGVTHPSYYGSTEIAIYIDDSQVDRDISHVIDESTSYWETNANEYLSFDVEYEIVEKQSAADKVLTFEQSTTCGTEYSDSYLGCADLITNDVDQTVHLSVDHRLSDPVMVDTTIHELGHTLGREHGDEPEEQMSSTYNEFDTSSPVKFYIRSEGGSVPTSVELEIERALEFYGERGEFTYELVDSEEEAHHLVTYDPSGTTCGFSTGGSCEIGGEYQSQIDFRLDQLDSEVVAWHVAIGLAGPSVDELPDELDPDDDRAERERFPR